MLQQLLSSSAQVPQLRSCSSAMADLCAGPPLLLSWRATESCASRPGVIEARMDQLVGGAASIMPECPHTQLWSTTCEPRA